MHPYKLLDSKAFWSTAVAKRGMAASLDLWNPKFQITQSSRVATFGSCFAQHFGRALREQKFNWVPFEHSPPRLNAESRKRFNYDVFSVRTGNIYTASMLLQWIRWALDGMPVPQEVWELDQRYHDPFRPAIEPNGFASVAEVVDSRRLAIGRFAAAMSQADLLVFTLGLTESWFNIDHGYEYPICPGTVAGEYNSSKHQFVNQDYSFIRSTLAGALEKLWSVNPGLRVLLTVSPVPLTATMSGNHVLVATAESKSILRAVAGSLARDYRFVDYFPSYEIISSPAFRGAFFEPNQRSVTPEGVATVMNCFFSSLRPESEAHLDATTAGDTAAAPISENVTLPNQIGQLEEDDVACEEALLEAFAPRAEG